MRFQGGEAPGILLPSGGEQGSECAAQRVAVVAQQREKRLSWRVETPGVCMMHGPDYRHLSLVNWTMMPCVLCILRTRGTQSIRVGDLCSLQVVGFLFFRV